MGIFDKIRPKGTQPPKPPAPPSKSGGGLIPASQQLQPQKKRDPFEIFRPGPPSIKPSGLIQPAAPVKKGIWDIIRPAKTGIAPAAAAVPVKKDVWDVIRPVKAEIAPTAPARTAFQALAPKDSQAQKESSAFDQWRAKEKPKSFADAIIPKGEAGSLYAPKQDLFKPEPAPAPAPAPKPKSKPSPASDEDEDEGDSKGKSDEDLDVDAAIRRNKSRGKTAKKKKQWEPPSVDEMAKLLKECLNLDKVWELARKDAKDEHFLEDLESGENEFGEGARAELQTIAFGDGKNAGTSIEEMFNFFGIPTSEIEDYLLGFRREESEESEESEDFDDDDAQEAILEDIDYPLRFTVYKAFEKLKPKDIRGRFEINDYHEGLINICYMEREEDYSPAEFKKLVVGIRKRREDAEAEYEKRLQGKKNKHKAFYGSWKVPSADEMVRFLEKKYDLKHLIGEIRKAKKEKSWKNSVVNTGEGRFIVEGFGSLDNPENIVKAARFLDVPEDLIARSYGNDDDHEMLWDHVIQPIDNALVSAFERILPKDLSGAINIYDDEEAGDESGLVLGYHEYEV